MRMAPLGGQRLDVVLCGWCHGCSLLVVVHCLAHKPSGSGSSRCGCRACSYCARNCTLSLLLLQGWCRAASCCSQASCCGDNRTTGAGNGTSLPAKVPTASGAPAGPTVMHGGDCGCVYLRSPLRGFPCSYAPRGVCCPPCTWQWISGHLTKRIGWRAWVCRYACARGWRAQGTCRSH